MLSALKILILTRQIRIIYGFDDKSTSNLYDDLYDYVIEDGHVIEFDQETKNKLWADSLNRFKNTELLVLRNHLPEDKHKEHRIKHYKSLLVEKYLLDIYKSTGQRLFLYNEEDPNKTPL